MRLDRVRALRACTVHIVVGYGQQQDSLAALSRTVGWRGRKEKSTCSAVGYR
jgi:hypothetical protein